MSDLISRKAAIDAIEPTLKSILQGNSFKAINVMDKIRELPSAQPERNKGKWIETPDGTMCGNCHKFPYDDGEYHIANWYSNYCPNCGCEMER